MFHKNAVFFNCLLLGVCGISYFSPMVLIIPIVFFSYLKCLFSSLSFIFPFVILFWFASFLFVLVSSLITRVKIGKPPVDSLLIAYKYGYSDSVSSSAVYSSYKLFPPNDKVQICYEKKDGPFGIAHGVVIHDQLTEDMKAILIDHGYNILKTKHISNAVYISCPIVPWLSHFGVWLILTIVYPRLYKYSKRHKLSAYPVVELYRKFSVTLMAPLSQQDIFVVPEAESLMCRSASHLNFSANSSVTDLSERSVSTSYHSARSTARVSLSGVDNNVTKLTPRLSLSPKSDKNTELTPSLCSIPTENNYTAKFVLKKLSPENNNVAKIPKHSLSPITISRDSSQGEE